MKSILSSIKTPRTGHVSAIDVFFNKNITSIIKAAKCAISQKKTSFTCGTKNKKIPLTITTCFASDNGWLSSVKEGLTECAKELTADMPGSIKVGMGEIGRMFYHISANLNGTQKSIVLNISMEQVMFVQCAAKTGLQLVSASKTPVVPLFSPAGFIPGKAYAGGMNVAGERW